MVTDKLDYPPGEIALLLGRGWAAQEAVRLEFSEDPLVHPAEVLHGLADDVGSFTAGYVVDNHDPGQFYYNVVYTGAGATTVGLVLPYPFVTQGATPVHVYSGVTSTVAGGSLCFQPQAEIANAKTQVTLASYGGNPTFASTTTVSVTLPPLPGGVAYINVHLDYGLKGTTGYAKDGNNNAIDAMSLAMRIPDKQAYPFSDSNGGSDSTPCCAEIRPTRNARKIACSSRTTSHSR